MKTKHIVWLSTLLLVTLSPLALLAETCKGETKDGLKVGIWKCYYANGNLSQEGNYVAGKKSGTWKLYHENGKMAGEGNYLNDSEQGKWKFYDEDGNLMLEQDFGG